MVTSAIYWALFLLLGAIDSATPADLRYYNGDLNSYVTTPLDTPLKLLPYLDPSKITVVYVFGFNSSPQSESCITVLTAYLSRNGLNVLLLDWSKEADTLLTSAEYPIVILRARKVASDFGAAIVQYIQNGISADSIRLCGHSLGAHLVGWAGKKVQESNYNVSRITGLDPAGPLFGCPIGFDGLKASAAAFVDVLHTNPGRYGTSESLGIVDFWANCDKATQPKCTGQGLKKDSCSHSHACDLHAEAITTPNSIVGEGASSCTKWKSGDVTDVTNYYGDNVNPSLTGNFYFSTNAQYPYARGTNGLTPTADT